MEASGSFLQGCTSTPQSVLLCTAWWCLDFPLSTKKKKSLCLLDKMFKTLHRLIQGHTLGCRAYHSSIWVSSSQESKVNSTSPRNRFCPKRSWCHTETCRLRVSSCEWLIMYCKTGATCSYTTGTALHCSCSQTHSAHATNHVAAKKAKIHGTAAHGLTLRFSLKTGLMELALILVFLLLCRDVSGSR